MSKHERPIIAGVIACVVACAACAALVALDDMGKTGKVRTEAVFPSATPQSPSAPAPLSGEPSTGMNDLRPADAGALKPCPRCGGQAAELADWVQTWCRCGECGFRTPARLSSEDARKLWNSCAYYGKPYGGERGTEE